MEAKMAVTAIAEMLLFHFATDPQHVIILGKTGAGKSSTMRLLAEDLVHFGRPVCVIDPKCGATIWMRTRRHSGV
jgi:type IV secretory pathway VirB4 component